MMLNQQQSCGHPIYPVPYEGITVKSLLLAAALGVLTACCSAPSLQEVSKPSVRHQYIIDVEPNIALHRAYNDDTHTYLEFLDTFRMNPVVTGVDGVPLAFAWAENLLTLDGVYDNLTVTTPHGVAHVYAKAQAPAARVAAATPPRALEYGVAISVARPTAPDNYGFTAELPARGDAVAPDHISVPISGNFSESLGEGRASRFVNATREANRVTISAAVAKPSRRAESRANLRMAEARQFLIDNGVSPDKIQTTKVVSNGAHENQVDFLIAY